MIKRKRTLRQSTILTALIVSMWIGGHSRASILEQDKKSPPNIVFILADDLGYGDLQSYGHPRIETPQLDELAREGTRFTQFYMSHSVCSPSRATLMNGQYPSRWHIYAHVAWLHANAERGMPDWLPLDTPSLPRVLQQQGYRTALFGKWHLGGGSGRHFGGRDINSANAPNVTEYGFDEARVIFGNGPTWLGFDLLEEAHDVYPYQDDVYTTWSSKIIVDASIQFLDQHVKNHRTQPFMINVWFHDPHVPLKPTPEMRARYDDVEDPGTQSYYAVVSNMDDQIGRLLTALDELGLTDNTIVIFSSDNGTPARSGSLMTGQISADIAVETDTAGSNGPLRGWKWHLYEGGIRVPLIVRWPGHVPAGRVDTTSVVHGTDFAPTWARVAGTKLPTEFDPDGTDVRAALFGQEFERTTSLFWHNPTAKRRGPSLAVRSGNWKLLMEYDGTDVQLFDLVTDTSEQFDLSAKYPDEVDRLSGELSAWYRTLPRPLDRSYMETR